MNETARLFERRGADVIVANLHKTYRIAEQDFSALRGVNCVMPAGQLTVIQGPSGCGKTTLMNIISTIDVADSGTVSIGGMELLQIDDEKTLARYRLAEVGFVFQSYNLIPGLSALDNLQLPMAVIGLKRADRNERAHALLRLVGLEGKAAKRPDELSGGEQQRVAIALALANDPPILLADEPTGNLDSTNAAAITALLHRLAHEFGKTIVVSTHDDLVGRRGDQRLQMRDGLFVDEQLS